MSPVGPACRTLAGEIGPKSSNVSLVDKAIERVMTVCRVEDHLHTSAADINLKIALSGSFHGLLLSTELPQQLRQFSNIHRNPARLIFGEQLRR